MRLRGVRRSSNVEDRRRSGGRVAMGGGLGGIALLIVLAIGYFAGVDVTPLLNNSTVETSSEPRELTPQEKLAGEFASQVLATTEEVWTQVLPEQAGREYTPPTLVLFSGQTASPCGGASGATGPFYCPLDQQAYLDTEFFATLEQQLGAEGDFAAAYVIAHEVAHHVQNLLGILPQVEEIRQQSNETQANALTVRLELQADCLSGVWATHVDGILEPGDVEEALNAAKMIGDDLLQKRAGRVPQPHTFTHGTSAQRSGWFARGYEAGNIAACDTFSGDI
ncbi:neutral zinc metallopeptidase [Salipiger pacificus]|nr:neutral zinc metallopeptidase [Alloyangia pacifica]MCA0945765.1 neutral zinc metallopeptidase [Alloyangia pacifica]